MRRKLPYELMEDWMNKRFMPCGLNAEWAVSAWFISGIHLKDAVYALDNEDGS